MNTSPENRDIEFELVSRARALHEHACEHIDARTRAKLAAARRQALTQKTGSRRAIWLPAAGAVAACALAIGVVWFKPQPAGTPAAPRSQAATSDSELPLDADAQQLDLYQNLDFYQWLAQQPRPHIQTRGSRQ